MRRPGNRGGRRYVVVAVLALVAILVGAVGPLAYGAFVDTSAKDRIEADPPPALFPDATVSPIGRKIDAQATTARTLMATWWRDHGRTPHDAQFVAWVERTLPGPPSRTERSAEIRQVQSLAARRTSAGVRAATWLEAYGKKDVWKLAMHDQAEMLPRAVGDRRKQELDTALKMAKNVADALGTRYQQSAPYVIDPSLRPDHTVTKGQVCPCSYPSRHATAGAAARTYLSFFAPHRDSDYRWTEDEIAYSRVYMAGHVPSDIDGGALLGDMIGEYFLVSRHHMTPPAA
ncbi:MAG TPA: phosphatase PAP2 family protein [Nocardioidaceae bacterium]